MAVLLGGDFRITQIGNQTVLEVHVFRSGGGASGNFFTINSTATAAIEADLASAGGGAISEPSIVPGTGIAVPDNTFSGRFQGSAAWDRASGEIYVDFPSGFSCASIIDIYARFILFNDPAP